MRQRGKLMGNRNKHQANDPQYVQSVQTSQMGYAPNFQTSQLGYASVSPYQFQHYTYPGPSSQQMDMGQLNSFFQWAQPPQNNPSANQHQTH